jgi:hypothetical protein
LANPELFVIAPLNEFTRHAYKIVKNRDSNDVLLAQTPISYSEDTLRQVIFSNSYVTLYTGQPDDKVEWSIRWEKISHCEIIDIKEIQFCVYPNITFPVVCSHEMLTAKLYNLCAHFAYRMGRPHCTVPVEDTIFCRMDEDLYPTSLWFDTRSLDGQDATSLHMDDSYTAGYIFGTANNVELKPLPTNTTESKIIKINSQYRIADNLSQYQIYQTVDKYLWKLIFDWTQCHKGIWKSKCCALLLINNTGHAIQLSRIDMIRGRKMWFFGYRGFDKTSRVLSPEGIMTVFLCGHASSLIKKGDTKFKMICDSFDITVSNKFAESVCENKSNNNYVDFVEKTENSNWCKYVVIVTSPSFLTHSSK